MRPLNRLLPAILLSLMRIGSLQGQDALIFPNEDRLTGSVVSVSTNGLTFASEKVGLLTVKWTDVKRIQLARAEKTVLSPASACATNCPALNVDVSRAEIDVSAKTLVVP